MLKARRKNRVIRIPDERMEEYKKLGYSITDENGNTVYQPEDKDTVIASLRAEIQQLKQKLTESELLLKQATQTSENRKPYEPPVILDEDTGGGKPEPEPEAEQEQETEKPKGKGRTAKAK